MAYKITSYALENIRPEVRGECFEKLCSRVENTYGSKEELLQELKEILHVTEYGLRSEVLLKSFKLRPTTKSIITVLAPFVLVFVVFISSLIFFNIYGNKEKLGDSFGVINTLFSGLAFSGMLIAILLQREELQLQRKELVENRTEFKKSAEAQEINAKLIALTSMLKEYKEQISKNNAIIESSGRNHMETLDFSPLFVENQDLIKRKQIIIEEIELILEKSGVKLSALKTTAQK